MALAMDIGAEFVVELTPPHLLVQLVPRTCHAAAERERTRLQQHRLRVIGKTCERFKDT